MSNFPKHSSLSLEELGRDVTTGITADKWRKPSIGPQAPSSDALPLSQALDTVWRQQWQSTARTLPEGRQEGQQGL